MTDAIPDFTSQRAPRPPHRFRIDADVFECTATLPSGATRDLIALARASEAGDNLVIIERLGAFMDAVMLPASKTRFVERLHSASEPIDDDQVGSIAVWLVETYGEGARPTVPSSSSANGLGDGGTSTTATAPTEG